MAQSGYKHTAMQIAMANRPSLDDACPPDYDGDSLAARSSTPESYDPAPDFSPKPFYPPQHHPSQEFGEGEHHPAPVTSCHRDDEYSSPYLNLPPPSGFPQDTLANKPRGTNFSAKARAAELNAIRAKKAAQRRKLMNPPSTTHTTLGAFKFIDKRTNSKHSDSNSKRGGSSSELNAEYSEREALINSDGKSVFEGVSRVQFSATPLVDLSKSSYSSSPSPAPFKAEMGNKNKSATPRQSNFAHPADPPLHHAVRQPSTGRITHSSLGYHSKSSSKLSPLSSPFQPQTPHPTPLTSTPPFQRVAYNATPNMQPSFQGNRSQTPYNGAQWAKHLSAQQPPAFSNSFHSQYQPDNYFANVSPSANFGFSPYSQGKGQFSYQGPPPGLPTPTVPNQINHPVQHSASKSKLPVVMESLIEGDGDDFFPDPFNKDKFTSRRNSQNTSQHPSHNSGPQVAAPRVIPPPTMMASPGGGAGYQPHFSAHGAQQYSSPQIQSSTYPHAFTQSPQTQSSAYPLVFTQSPQIQSSASPHVFTQSPEQYGTYQPQQRRVAQSPSHGRPYVRPVPETQQTSKPYSPVHSKPNVEKLNTKPRWGMPTSNLTDARASSTALQTQKNSVCQGPSSSTLQVDPDFDPDALKDSEPEREWPCRNPWAIDPDFDPDALKDSDPLPWPARPAKKIIEYSAEHFARHGFNPSPPPGGMHPQVVRPSDPLNYREVFNTLLARSGLDPFITSPSGLEQLENLDLALTNEKGPSLPPIGAERRSESKDRSAVPNNTRRDSDSHSRRHVGVYDAVHDPLVNKEAYDRGTIDLFSRVFAHMANGKTGNDPSYASRYADPAPWTIDNSRDGNKSLYGGEWGDPPQRVARDPRYNNQDNFRMGYSTSAGPSYHHQPTAAWGSSRPMPQKRWGFK